MIDKWSAYEVAAGRSLLAFDGDEGLADDPDLWREVWEETRDAAIAEWVRTTLCTRPRAFYLFDADDLPSRYDDETEPAWLYRIGELAPDELEDARKRYDEVTAFNANQPDRNRISPSPVDELIKALIA